MHSLTYHRRLRIWETNFGREAGWLIERHGQPIAILTEPRSEDMFWDSYRLEILTNDPELRQRFLTSPSAELNPAECLPSPFGKSRQRLESPQNPCEAERSSP